MNERDSNLLSRLFALQDLNYKAFHCALIPTVDPNAVIGVRTPMLRALAKEFGQTAQAKEFLKQLPHKYYEENNLHGMLISSMKDYGQAVAALDSFLPYVDNWATCDLIRPKIFKKQHAELPQKVRIWMASEHTYTVRFGIEMLMSFYLDEHFRPKYLDWVSSVRSEEYYVNMMIAWYFATALAKQYDAALPYLEEQRLDQWTHNKTIQKAIESYRISPEQKEHLRGLRRKT